MTENSTKRSVTASLADRTWTELASAGTDSILLVPIGSTEQHGPHLPLSTDTDIAVGLAARLAAQSADVVVAPAVAYGSSGEHADFAGTLSIGQAGTELLLVELCRSAARSFRRIRLLSAHGGNAEPLRRAEERLLGEGLDVRVLHPSFSGDAHAGRIETSLMLALHPERVRSKLAEAGTTTPVEELMPAMVESGVRAVSPTGVLGDPAGASAAEGRALLDEAVRELAEQLG